MADDSKKTRFDYRSKFRQRSHDDAHADDAGHVDIVVPDHVLAARGKPELVTTSEQLASLINHLRQVGSFAYDSEFIGESSYFPRLCLIQVATTEHIWLVDPLTIADLTPFWKLLADASVEKILHAAEQDVEPVGRLIQDRARHVFDTQIAAGFVALSYPTSLAKLMNELLGVTLYKGATFTHWDQRPLSAKQLRYAADDVRYLPAAALELKKRLATTGHLDFVRQECDSLCEPSQYIFNPDTAYERVRGVGSLEPKQINVLKQLVLWRDGQARLEDLPSRSFLKDEVLVELCKTLPKNMDRLSTVRGLPRPVIQQDGDLLLSLIVKGLQTSTEGIETLRNTESTPSERFNADALWAAAQLVCASKSIDPAVVSSRQQIGELYRAYADKSDLTTLPIMQSWRKIAIGNALLELLSGKGLAGIHLPNSK